MDKPTVRVVYRVSLPTDSYGRITPGPLHTDGSPFPQGTAVVLDVADGWWMQRSDIEHVASALSHVGHISVTGAHAQRGGGKGQFGIVYGLAAIAESLDALLAAPPLSESA